MRDEQVPQPCCAEDASQALVQDTAWPGYEDVPGWIVAGYPTLLEEIDEALGRAPDLVVVPPASGPPRPSWPTTTAVTATLAGPGTRSGRQWG